MSELQAALLAVGFGVIVAVYVYGWWQQRRYRRKFGAAFKTSHADALYQEAGAGQVREKVLADMVGEAIGDSVSPADSAASLLDESCALLDVRSDFIIELQMNEASPSGVLDGFWQRKFDFGKPVHVCGMALNSAQWERAIADGKTLYSRFRIALQLVDRGGAISDAKLADFRDLVLGVAGHIKADAAVPDLDKTHRHAVEMDGFCAEVDQMAGVNLVPPGTRLLQGAKIAQAAALFGMTLESDGAFHSLNAQRYSVFSLINLDAEPFQHHTLETFDTAGITLLLDVPRTENPALEFDQMMRVAHGLARELQADLVDDHRVLLSESGVARIRAKIVEVEAKMRDNGIEPGSAQACRLFS
jgi:FtsZ-interacting cell division protein ZipA